LSATVQIFTVATERNAGLDRFSASLTRFAAQPVVCGRGEFFHGYAWRFKKLVAAVREATADVVVFADAYDSVCLEDPALALERFAALGHPIVFSFEAQKQPEPYLGLNAGLMIAERAGFLDVFTDKLLEELFPDHFNDQIQLQTMLSWVPDLFRLDIHSEIFFTSLNGRAFAPSAKPVFVHGPYGGSLEWLEPQLEGIYAQAS
jgi:hypothetical protein